MAGEGIHPGQMDMNSMEGFNPATTNHEANTQLELNITSVDNQNIDPPESASATAKVVNPTPEIHLDLTKENAKEKQRALEREEALELAAQCKKRDLFQMRDKHLVPVLDLAERYFNGGHFPKDKEIALYRIFGDNFSLKKLELLAEALEMDYRRVEIDLAESAAKIAEARAEAYSEHAQDNEVNAVKTEEERLNALARQAKAKYLNLISFNNALAKLLRSTAHALSDDYEP